MEGGGVIFALNRRPLFLQCPCHSHRHPLLRLGRGRPGAPYDRRHNTRDATVRPGGVRAGALSAQKPERGSAVRCATVSCANDFGEWRKAVRKSRSSRLSRPSLGARSRQPAAVSPGLVRGRPPPLIPSTITLLASCQKSTVRAVERVFIWEQCATAVAGQQGMSRPQRGLDGPPGLAPPRAAPGRLALGDATPSFRGRGIRAAGRWGRGRRGAQGRSGRAPR